ncbi:MAG TPA: prepilin-type N-terminal cleavage/methylation domain-containing protein [Desulfobacterales bacterium]|nr:prepilin-type N-terminal cleavage/methylation domain-containing protein [Desulfobacterales bacterium]HIP39625.1 prepilin-type N-terminal cleavage/methylation domain-containing protein [Desulfocapsa sulfexigens]
MYIKRCKQASNHQGFSLVELAVTLSIIGILATIASPMYTSGPDKRLKAAARTLWADIRFVRMEAVKRRTDIGIQFTPGVFATGGQVGSYTIFLDNGFNGGAAINPAQVGDGIMNAQEGTTPLKVVNMPRDVSLISTSFPNNSIGYNSRALPNGVNNGNAQMRNTRSFYRLTLSQAGSFRIESSQDNGVTWNEN